jgi:hypothetical protein
MTQIYEKGTIKIVWIEDSELIYSKMFESEEDAEKFAHDKKDYLIFKLVTQKNMEDFSWVILPYGRYKIYKLLFDQYKNGLLSKLIGGWPGK